MDLETLGVIQQEVVHKDQVEVEVALVLWDHSSTGDSGGWGVGRVYTGVDGTTTSLLVGGGGGVESLVGGIFRRLWWSRWRWKRWLRKLVEVRGIH